MESEVVVMPLARFTTLHSSSARLSRFRRLIPKFGEEIAALRNGDFYASDLHGCHPGLTQHNL